MSMGARPDACNAAHAVARSHCNSNGMARAQEECRVALCVVRRAIVLRQTGSAAHKQRVEISSRGARMHLGQQSVPRDVEPTIGELWRCFRTCLPVRNSRFSKLRPTGLRCYYGASCGDAADLRRLQALYLLLRCALAFSNYCDHTRDPLQLRNIAFNAHGKQ
jgi:hypothetical protein